MSRLKTALIAFTGFTAASIAISIYRYWFVFRKLCRMESGMPSGSQGLMDCPGFLDVFLVTSISPGYFLISLLVGILSTYIYNRAGQ